MKNKVAILAVYFGRLPSYFEYTKKGIHFNKDFNWFIFSDQFETITIDKNITYIPISFKEINLRLKALFNDDFNISSPYKLIDLRPLYADLFYDYIKDYNWWGFTDLDVIYGDFSKFINDKILDNFDIIGYVNKTLFGPFCLLNIKHRKLYLEIENISMLLKTKGYYFSQGYYIDERYFCDLIKKKKLKIHDRVYSDKNYYFLTRQGHPHYPITWINGKIELESLKCHQNHKEDYIPEIDTMIYHFSPKNITFLDISKNEFKIIYTSKNFDKKY